MWLMEQGLQLYGEAGQDYYVMDEKPERFAQFAVDVMGVEESDDVKSTALKGIEAVEEFYRMIEMPTNMKELGI